MPATGVLLSGARYSLSRHPVARVTFLLKVSACIRTLAHSKCAKCAIKLRYLDEEQERRLYISPKCTCVHEGWEKGACRSYSPNSAVFINVKSAGGYCTYQHSLLMIRGKIMSCFRQSLDCTHILTSTWQSVNGFCAYFFIIFSFFHKFLTKTCFLVKNYFVFCRFLPKKNSDSSFSQSKRLS